MPYVWECPVHGKQAISFQQPDILVLETLAETPECPKPDCERGMGFTYRD